VLKVRRSGESSRVGIMSNINKAYRSIFIHVPKTAGSSMEQFSFVGGDSHATAQTIKNMVGDTWNSYFKWGFVRDPLDRFVSAFFHQPNITGFTQDERGFESFVRFVGTLGIDNDSAKKGTGVIHHHFIPQSYFLCDDKGKILVDFVGRYSRIGQDWNKVCEKLGVRTPELPVKREGYHKHYTNYYNNDLIDIVKKLYKDDYKIFKEF
jgi:chondroitin 4-sulfotransferase 11